MRTRSVTTTADAAGGSTNEITSTPHPIIALLVRRIPLGLLSILIAATIVYWATFVLPGDAATAILGNTATPVRLAQLRAQLGLDQGPFQAFGGWLWDGLHGDFGVSMTQQRPVWDAVEPRLWNSMVLVLIAAVLSTVIGIALGLITARRPDSLADSLLGAIALIASSLPEFVVAVFVLLALSVGPLHWFPALSATTPGTPIWADPTKLVLPVLTLLIVVTPYVYRMVRAATIDALSAEYCEVALLKGTSSRHILTRHALPNALAPTIQVVGLNLLYLAGGIVMVETIFTFPGIGSMLVEAIDSRDVQLIQFLVVLLAVFYVIVNITADVLVLIVTPRKRFPR